jgi:hypothetical protein
MDINPNCFTFGTNSFDWCISPIQSKSTMLLLKHTKKWSSHKHVFPSNLKIGTTNHGKWYSKESKLVFEYGNPDFAAVCKPGNFYVDRTNYIPLLEHSGKVLTFLRPRRFGKTMVVSMLDYYYNILYKDRFEELFGHLEIGKKPTSEKNSFLVFDISFSSLETDSVASFKQSLNDRLNGAVTDFKDAYESIFGENIHKIQVHPSNGIESFTSLLDFVKKTEFRSKVTPILLNCSCIFSLMNTTIQSTRH